MSREAHLIRKSMILADCGERTATAALDAVSYCVTSSGLTKCSHRSP
jgi:hypothetical protein